MASASRHRTTVIKRYNYYFLKEMITAHLCAVFSHNQFYFTFNIPLFSTGRAGRKRNDAGHVGFKNGGRSL